MIRNRINNVIVKIIAIAIILIMILPNFIIAVPTSGGQQYIIALDAGHGGDDGAGAYYNGLKEEVMTEATVSYMTEYFKQYDNITIVKCPKTGRGHYDERPAAAKSNNANLHVTIHYNAGGGSGLEVLYKSSSDSQSVSLAQTVLNGLCNATGLKSRGIKQRGDLGIISTTSTIGCPSICVEGGFIDSDTDRAVIGTNEGLKRVAAGAVAGCLAYLNIENKGFGDIPDFDYSTIGSTLGSSGSFITGIEVEGNEKKFLGLWKNSTGKYEQYYNDDGTINENALYNPDGKLVKYGSAGSPVENIFGASDWFFDLLALSERTQKHEQLMRYLMYVYSGRDYGVTEFDFSVFDAKSFSSVSGGSSKFVEYLKAWEGAATNSAGNYIVEHNDGDVPTVGYGVAVMYNVDRIKSICNYSGDPLTWVKGEELLSKYGITNEQIDKVKEAEVEENRISVKEATAGLGLTKQQEDALIAIKYQYGNIGNFVEMYKQYGNTEELRKNVVDNSEYRYKIFETGKYSRFKSEWELKRSAANWKLFHEGIYTDSNGNEIVGGSSLLEAADYIHEYMEKNGYGYCMAGRERDRTHGGKGGACGLDATFEESKTKHKLTCCATYVSWVLYECGYTEFVNVNGCSALDSMLRNLGAQEIKDYSQLQAGDICFNGTTHVQIYAGDGKWFNAGSNNAISRENPYTATFSDFTHALRLNV